MGKGKGLVMTVLPQERSLTLVSPDGPAPASQVHLHLCPHLSLAPLAIQRRCAGLATTCPPHDVGPLLPTPLSTSHPIAMPQYFVVSVTGCASAMSPTFRSSALVGCSPFLDTGSFSPLCSPFLSTGPHGDPAASLTGALSRSPRVTPKDPHLYPQQRGSGPLPPISDPPAAASRPPPPPFGSGNVELQVCPDP